MAKDAISFIYPNPSGVIADVSGLPIVITSYYQYSDNYTYGGWDGIPPSGQVAYPLAGNHAFTVISDRPFGNRKVHTLETHHTLNEPMKRFYRITVRYGTSWTYDGKETLGWPVSKYRNVNNFEKIEDFKRTQESFTIPLEQHTVTDSDYWALVMKISSNRYSTQKSFHSTTVVTYLYLDDLTQIGGVNELVSQSGELTDCIFFDIVRYDETIPFLTGRSLWDECRVPSYLSGNPHSSSYGMSGNYPPNGAGSYYQYSTNIVDFGTENLRNASYNYSDCILDSGLIINDILSGSTNIRIPRMYGSAVS